MSDYVAAFRVAAARRRQTIDNEPAPEIRVLPGPLRIGADEHWCVRCGEVMTAGYCVRCGSRRCRPAVQVLRSEEFYVVA